ncbi:sensor histidine kinase [Arthrobacter gandavensis]|uniref:sensor histidine kinase n=1 Tax=Arthrobacter gandavensis TaxID=169960 RepID=UPI0018907BEE|nr:sensor histidine kinase [Arthrobacter gandavensis]MBF4994810.1 sensor histidine kinase [Arthrobacter gandavensis]
MRKWSLASRLLIGQLAFILCLSAGLSWALYVQAEQHSYEETADRMLSVAETIAADPFVLEAVAGADPSSALQPYASSVMGSAHVDFLTIMAPDRTRYTHRNASEIGRQYIGSVDQALTGSSFTEVYTGTLGPSVRAIVPVLDSRGEVRALVAAGLTVDRVAIARDAELPGLFIIATAALAWGSLASFLLSRYLRRTTQDRRPDELAGVFAFHDAALHSLREGLLLINNDGDLVLCNDQAAELLGLPSGAAQSPTGFGSLGLPAPLAELLRTGRTAVDEFHFTKDRILVINQSPAVAAGTGGTGRGRKSGEPRRLGTVTTLRDHTEVEALTGELQSMRTLTDALQAQAHEHANRLHTVVSLIELDRPAEALEFATRDLEQSQQLADDVVSAVGEPALAALLAGKKAQARERGIDVELELQAVPEDGTGPAVLDSGELVTIVGNLVDNAMDAVQGLPDPKVTVHLAVADDGGQPAFRLSVRDSGPGIPAESQQRIFEQGFSTKAALPGSGRGFGLALVNQAVLRLGGTLRLDSTPERPGARFTVLLPLPEGARR